jgi:tetratricopeptide (TPR) repeat protein
MRFLYAMISFMLLSFSQADLVASEQSPEQGPDLPKIQIRSNNHPGFCRIVLEGPKDLVNAVGVYQEEKNIIVRFSAPDFVVQEGKMRIPYRRNDNTIAFKPEEIGEMKVFTLRDPSRLVIDVYQKTRGNDTDKAGDDADHIKEKSASKKIGRKASLQGAPALKSAGRVGNQAPAVKKSTRTVTAPNAEVTGRGDKENNHTNALINQMPENRDKGGSSLSLFSTDAEASTMHEKEKPANTQRAKSKNEADTAGTTGGNDDFVIPDKFKRAWEVLKKENNPYRVITEFSEFKPVDAASLAAYHFIYGEASDAAKQYFDAIEHLRLAYIYASHEKLKELALFRRAEVYVKMGLFYEAKSNYVVFINDYPSSKYITQAHLGLANSLSETGSFAEAVEHYEKAGRSPEVLFNMANALQKLEKVEEARKAYANAMIADSAYPERSEETYFLFAENLRMSGKLNEAKRLLLTIESGPFRDQARISLGLIATDGPDLQEATSYFQSVIFSRDMKVRVKALFNLSLVYLKAGKLKESVSTLEEIRKNYPDSSMYDDALLVLSKLYRKEGKIRESVALLKELVYGKQPPKEAFAELEEILLEVGGKKETGAAGEVGFVDLWRDVGQWLLDETRGDFLLKVSARLKQEGKPFVQLCSWLAENATGRVKIAAAIDLADYYAGLEDTRRAEKYIAIVKGTSRELKDKESGDVMLRVEARIDHADKRNLSALNDLMSVRDFDRRDLKLLADIINQLKESGADIEKASAYYEKMINRVGGESEDYVRLGDILYEQNEQKALVYYRTAHEKDPEDEWTIYRIGLIVDMPETNEMFGKLEKGDSLLSRVARNKVKEINLLNRIEEVYQ